MDNLLSIFNSKRVPWAAILTVLAVVALEIFFAHTLPEKCYSRNVIDDYVYRFEHERYDSDVLFIGDSVGYDMMAETDINDRNEFKKMTSLFDIETPGQYFLMKRYLENNKPPKVVVFMGINPLGYNLEGGGKENFVQRCFLDVEEISQLTHHKGFQFGLVMLSYKLFPSFRYRVHLQEDLVGFSNINIFNGRRENLASALDVYYRKESGEHSILKFFKRKWKVAISDIYFEKLLQLLEEKNVKLLFVLGVHEKSILKNEKRQQKTDQMFQKFSEWRKKYRNFDFVYDIPILESSFFKGDKVHLMQSGQKIVGTRLKLILLERLGLKITVK